jgi:preprotein translocase subunit SecY
MELITAKVKAILLNKETRSKILFTAFVILIFRFLAVIPLPGINPDTLLDFFKDNPFSTIFSLTTGGRLDSPSLVAIGLGSYISASIIVQLLQTVIPKLEEISKEGQRGRMILNQITRYLTIPLSIIQAIVIYTLFSSAQFSGLIVDTSRSTIVAFILAITAGTVFLMWLAEAITENGIGQGSTIIILVGIMSTLPGVIPVDFENYFSTGQFNFVIGLIAFLFGLFLLVVFFNQAVRKIPIQYSNRVRSVNSSYDTAVAVEKSYFPIKPTIAGVMPVIFASALASLPSYVAQYFMTSLAGQESRKLYQISEWLTNNIYNTAGGVNYNFLAIEVVLIMIFTFMYTITVFKPVEVADNLKKSGAFIPGIRPGDSTVAYISFVLWRVTLVGAIFLSIVAISPSIITAFSSGVQINLFTVIGGTSLLIIVSGILEVIRQVDALLLNRSYDKYSVL